MDTLTWVILTNAAVWLGIGGYAAFLAGRQRARAARIDRMELLSHD